MNTPVSFPLAKLLKEKDFVMPTFYYYENHKLVEPYLENGSSTDTEFRVDLSDLKEHFNKHSKKVSAPTIAEVVMWLYEKHGIWVYSYPVQPLVLDDEEYPKTVWVVKCLSMNQVMFEKFINAENGLAINHHNSPKEAYEAAVIYTLNNLI